MHSLKQTILLGAMLLALIIASAGISHTPTDTAVGRKAPIVQLGDVQSSIRSDELRGRYVLVTFWNSSDAASREAANRYNAWFSANKPSNMSYVGINFDNDRGLFDEVVRRDSLDNSVQYNVTGREAHAIASTYHLEYGYGSLLISPQGRIISHNPSPSQLASVAR